LPPATPKSQQGDGELQIDAALAYQERTWRVQRIGWAIFAVLIVLGLIGLFGPGPLSSTTVGASADGLRIDYDRFARLHAPTTLVIHADRRVARGDELGIVLSGDAIRALELVATTPPADGTSVAPDGAILRFKADRQPGELTIVLYAKPQQAGPLTSRIGVAGGPAHTIRQWIYP
jgi:hypothetical protein